MKIILSPAKQMVQDTDTLAPRGVPVFLESAQELRTALLAMSSGERKALWNCSDKLAAQSEEQLFAMDLCGQLTPAILAYRGIAYQYMAPGVFENGEFSYVQEHLRILSGFYGVLKPMDGVAPYRLEMQAPLSVGGAKDLYDYWGRRLYDQVRDESGMIINLASREYARCVEPYLTADDRFITCVFGEMVNDKVLQKGVYAKMARGEMVRYMAVHHVEDPGEMQGFDTLGFRFSPELSDENTYTFLRR